MITKRELLREKDKEIKELQHEINALRKLLDGYVSPEMFGRAVSALSKRVEASELADILTTPTKGPSHD